MKATKLVPSKKLPPGRKLTRMRRTVWSNEKAELKKNLIQYLGKEGVSSLSRSKYEKIRMDVGRDKLPSFQTILSLAPDSESFIDAISILTDGEVELELTLKSRTGRVFWSDSEIMKYMRLWIAEEEKLDKGNPDLKLSSYQKWREGANESTPATGTIYSRFGSWESAVENAVNKL